MIGFGYHGYCPDGKCKPETWTKPPDAIDAPMLIEIDYTKTDDYIDRECKRCGRLDGKHVLGCKEFDQEWIRILEGA